MLAPTLSFYQILFEFAPPLRPLSAEEVTEGAELMLDTARQQSCPYWLLDGRRHDRPQPPALHFWMQDEYFPRVRTALGQQACVAFLAQSRARQQTNPNGMSLQEWNSSAVRMGWFTDEAAAWDWLNRCRAQ